MGDHVDIDHTGLTGVGGSVATDAIFDAKGDIPVGTGANTSAKRTVGANGTVLTADSAETTGVKWATAGTGQGLKDFAFASRTSGTITVNGTSWANLDTGLDLAITAATGDIIQVGISAAWNSEAVNAGLDVVSLVSAAPVNSLATGATPSDSNHGIAGWFGGSGVVATPGSSVMYTLQSGDISGGTVTLRLRVRTLTAANKTLNATAPLPLAWWAKNLGAAL